MKLKEFVSLLDKSLEKDPNPDIYMYISPNKLEELYELDKEWERAKESGEYFNILVDIDIPGTVLIYPDRYPELLAMRPTGKKIYPKDESLRTKLGVVTGLQAEITRKEEDEKYR
jgi:hypothetical protein